jgi:hypothetical protein
MDIILSGHQELIGYSRIAYNQILPVIMKRVPFGDKFSRTREQARTTICFIYLHQRTLHGGSLFLGFCILAVATVVEGFGFQKKHSVVGSEHFKNRRLMGRVPGSSSGYSTVILLTILLCHLAGGFATTGRRDLPRECRPDHQ